MVKISTLLILRAYKTSPGKLNYDGDEKCKHQKLHIFSLLAIQIMSIILFWKRQKKIM